MQIYSIFLRVSREPFLSGGTSWPLCSIGCDDTVNKTAYKREHFTGASSVRGSLHDHHGRERGGVVLAGIKSTYLDP